MEPLASVLSTFRGKGNRKSPKPTVVPGLHSLSLLLGTPMLYRVHFSRERSSIRGHYRYMSTSADRATSITTALISIPKDSVVTAGEVRKTFPSTEDVKDNVPATLRKIPNNFFHEAISPDNLKVAWMQLKSNPGMMARTSSSETLNQISQD